MLKINSHFAFFISPLYIHHSQILKTTDYSAKNKSIILRSVQFQDIISLTIWYMFPLLIQNYSIEGFSIFFFFFTLAFRTETVQTPIYWFWLSLIEKLFNKIKTRVPNPKLMFEEKLNFQPQFCRHPFFPCHPFFPWTFWKSISHQKTIKGFQSQQLQKPCVSM